MPNYAVFGGCLSSPLEFPEFAEVQATVAPSWTLVLARSAEADPSLEYLGEDVVNADVRVRLYRSAKGFRLVYDDTGTFDISQNGAVIHWAAGPNADPVSVRRDVLGRVIATAMHAAGRVCLHGSAVALATGAIAFLAPQKYGKSTLATATLATGAKLLTDDSLPVDLGPPAMAHPGVPGVRLWKDARARLDTGDATAHGTGPKRMLTDLAPESLMLEPQPLRAIYLLAPYRSESIDDCLQRQRLPTVQSALSLVRHAKLGSLLGKTEATTLLDRASTLAMHVPVYILRVVRDFDRLNAAVEQLRQWHGEVPPPTPSGSLA